MIRRLQPLWTARAAAVVWLPVLAVVVLHYGSDPHAHGTHDLARRLFYLPIVLGGILGGLPGGLLVAVVVDLLYLPHAFLLEHGADPQAGTEKLLEIGFYPVLGALAGGLTDLRSREERRRIALQEELRARELELARAARLQSLGQLTAGLAHEIRNPLHAMRGTAEILLDAVADDAPEKAVGRNLLAEIDRLSAVLKRFLDFARGAPPRFEPVSLDAVASTVADLVRAQAARQGTEVVVTPGAVTVEGDRDQLVQVGLGIAINGLQALGAGGALSLSVQREGSGGALVLENDGPPIPPELLDRIFDPFVSTREEGTGLGLSQAWRIVDQHRGRIEVTNLPRGVRFRVILP